MNICEHLTWPARLFPDREAIAFGDLRLTYGHLDELSSRAAAWLQSRGVQPGDRVGIVLPNVPAFVVWYYGVLRLGAVAVSISTRLAPSEVAFVLSDCQARVLVAEPEMLGSLNRELPEGVEATCGVNESGDRGNEAVLAPGSGATIRGWVSREPRDPAVILYTSGTTGQAKGATLSHQNVRATVHAFNHLCEMRTGDRILLAVPLFHCYGQNALLNAGFNVGATLILQRRFDLLESKRLIAGERVNRLFGVPTTFQLLESCCEPADLAAVEYCFSAAAPLPIQLSRRWQEKFSMPIFEGYGLTETAPFASYNHRLRFVPGSIGTPVDLCEMKIVNTDTGETCPPGELGEIAIRGPNVMLGYWNRPQETAAAVRDGWFYSGDIGRVDENGYFYIVDRVKDMISVGGLKVYPAEVERVLLDHPAVSEAAVVGFPDDVFGEKVVAFVVGNQSAEPLPVESIRQNCQAQLADFKVPRQFLAVPELPRNPAGKVLKIRLRETQWPELRFAFAGQRSPAAGNHPSLAGVESPIPPVAGGDPPWIEKLRSVHPAGRRRELTALIQHAVRDITGTSQLPGPEERFIEAGLDSLMIVDLRDRLQLNVGPFLELPATLVFDFPRICDLAAFLAESIDPDKKIDTAPAGRSAVTRLSGAGQDRPTKQDFAESGFVNPADLSRQVQSLSEDQALQELLREINE